MKRKQLTNNLFVSEQISLEDVRLAAEAGIKTIVCNRPENEDQNQIPFSKIETEANSLGISTVAVPVVGGSISDDDVTKFTSVLNSSSRPILAYCRTGTRSTILWGLSRSGKIPLSEVLEKAAKAGYDISSIKPRFVEPSFEGTVPFDSHDILIIGGGAAGVAVAASLKARRALLDVAIVDPADTHFYQPGWTMVGAGIFNQDTTARPFESVIPKGVKRINASVEAFEPEQSAVVLSNGERLGYKRLIVAPGAKLDWDAVEGLTESLGRNGVTSNYRYDLAPYTWELVQNMKSGRALFTQPPMPIKCAGAPQKAMYLSGDHWHRNKCLKDIDIEFHNAGGVLFGVKEYIPALMKYVQKYDADLEFFSNLVAIDADKKIATFEVSKPDTEKFIKKVEFNFIHVCPPQTAPDFIRSSPLADQAGWVDVDQVTLRHKTFDNIWSLGDVMNAPNAKTAAAARKQAPIVAHNLVADIDGQSSVAHYDGYGACPLTVERGKIVLAEFGYGGKRMPSFPSWINNDLEPTSIAWLLKSQILPPLYWNGMLKGREWMAKPLLVGA